MKRLSWFNKTMYFFNILLAIVTVVAYILPFLAPKLFPILSVLTLILPLILVLNLLFFVYWSIQLKRQLLLSVGLLLIGFTFVNKFYKFSLTNLTPSEDDFKVMSYNVRLFNKFEWSDKETVPIEISDFVKENKPDILCVQEFSNAKSFDYSNFKHKFIRYQGQNIKTGQAIFSQFKIINSGEIVFPETTNNVIFVDILKKQDTIRIYSIHLQSIKISVDVNEINNDLNEINKKKSKRMFKQLSKTFEIQQLQSEQFLNHKMACKYPIIICGDMNNSAFSYVYRNIKGDCQDSFVEAGKGFGKTYDFKYYPARIDYIFVSPNIQVKEFNTFNEIIDSDHFPIMGRYLIQ